MMRAPPKARAGGDGIAAAFTEFRSALTRLVARIVGPHCIEDIVQETFIRSYEASRKQTINHPRSFMWKTAKNLALNHLAELQQQTHDQRSGFQRSGCLFTDGGRRGGARI